MPKFKTKLFICIASLVVCVLFCVLLYPPRPLVSVVMCVYNGAKSGDLDRSIPSILNQSYSDFEFIIVEDGSSDNSWEVLSAYAAKDPRIKLVRNDGNKGISYSRNRGNDLARGKYIMVMDQDDVSLPNRVLKQAAFMEARPWLDIVSTPSITPQAVSYQYNQDEISWLLFFGNNLGHPNLMMKRSFLKDHHIRYNADFKCANDYDLLVHAFEKGAQFGTMYEALFAYSGPNYSKKGSVCWEEVPKIYSQFMDNGVSKPDYFEDWACQVATHLIKTQQYKHLLTPGFLELKQAMYCRK